jgi:hypothetical protein
VQGQQVLGPAAVLGAGLHHHLVHLPEADEVGGVVAAHQGLQRAHGRVDGHALFGGHVLVDVNQVLREVGVEAGEGPADGRVLAQGREEGLRHGGGFLQVAAARLIQQAQLEAAAVAEARHRGRRQKLNVGVADVLGFFFQLGDEGGHRLLALVPGLEVNHAHAVAGAGHLVHQAVAGQRRHRLHRLQLAGNALHLVEHGLGALHGGAGGRGHVHVHHALVFGGIKPAGNILFTPQVATQNPTSTTSVTTRRPAMARSRPW